MTRTAERIEYVWIEVYPIELFEEDRDNGPGRISTKGWADTSDLQDQVDAAKALDPSPRTSILMRKEEWDRRRRD